MHEQVFHAHFSKSSIAPEDPTIQMLKPKTEMIFNYLNQQGFQPTLDEEGDIQFEYDGMPWFIHPEDDDEQLLKIFSFAWRSDLESEDEDDQEMMLALQVANICTAKHDTVKVIALPDRLIVVAVEQFYEPFESFKGTFLRVLNALKNCTDDVQQLMEEGFDDFEDDDEDEDFDPESN